MFFYIAYQHKLSNVLLLCYTRFSSLLEVSLMYFELKLLKTSKLIVLKN